MFLTEFLKHENLYLREMTSITVGKSTSFDHIFKVATTIGYLREDNISGFLCTDELFIILNEMAMYHLGN